MNKLCKKRKSYFLALKHVEVLWSGKKKQHPTLNEIYLFVQSVVLTKADNKITTA